MRAVESYSVQGQFGVQFVAQDLNADFNGEVPRRPAATRMRFPEKKALYSAEGRVVFRNQRFTHGAAKNGAAKRSGPVFTLSLQPLDINLVQRWPACSTGRSTFLGHQPRYRLADHAVLKVPCLELDRKS